MIVASVTAELAPWCKTGGLGDVAGALPAALTDIDATVRHASFVPLYSVAKKSIAERGEKLTDTGVTVSCTLAGRPWHGRWLALVHDAPHEVYFLECDALLSTPGLYDVSEIELESGDTWTPSLSLKFAFLCDAAFSTMKTVLGREPDIVHCHDWHTGPLVRRISQSDVRGRPASLLTIHNLAYQGDFPGEDCPELLEPNASSLRFLEMGIRYADEVSTVSPRYSSEIQTEAFGCGLHELLSGLKIHGILNGIGQEWSPATDSHLAAPYSSDDTAGKKACRAQLLKQCGWPVDTDDLILGVVARLDFQKGLDWVADTITHLEQLNTKMVLLGTGDPALETRFKSLTEAKPTVFSAHLIFDVPLSHKIVAGADALLVPSRFEPCGLTQLYAMRYGTVPIVNPVGGLYDTVIDADDPNAPNQSGTGFVMQDASAPGLRKAIERAASLWHRDRAAWTKLVKTGYEFDSSWQASAQQYLTLMRQMMDNIEKVPEESLPI